MKVLKMLIILIGFILLNIYLFVRGWQVFPSHTWLHIIYSVFFVFASTAFFMSVFLGNRLPLWMSRILDLIGGYWMILFIFFIVAVLIGDISRVANHFFGIYPDWVRTHYDQVKIYYLIVIAFFAVSISFIGYYNFNNPRITHITLDIDKPKQNNSDIKVIVVSDIHLGHLIRKGRLEKWVALINKQKPELILIAGDVFDHNLKAVYAQNMDQTLSKLSAPYGVYAIPGNHDYFAGIEDAVQYLQNAGIHVLRDSVVTVDQKLVLIGRDDLTNRNRKPLKSIVQGVSRNLPWIVLDHQPSAFNESIDNKVDIHFSGHTHNGQFFPVSWVVSKIYPLAYGYKKMDNTHFYVSSGLGLWGAAIRLGTHSEIVQITIR
jgi:uncharacterized protein